MTLRVTLNAAFLAATMGLSAQTPMKAPAGGKAISDELIGIFFEDISFSIGEGQKVGLIAKNGTGKSTLLYLIAGLLRPQAGSVCCCTTAT